MVEKFIYIGGAVFSFCFYTGRFAFCPNMVWKVRYKRFMSVERGHNFLQVCSQ